MSNQKLWQTQLTLFAYALLTGAAVWAIEFVSFLTPQPTFVFYVFSLVAVGHGLISAFKLGWETNEDL